jgi:hypothetical protein
MKHRPITVTAGNGSNQTAEADLIECSNCGSDAFHMFQLKTGNHPHIQCVDCETTFCCGDCERKPS